MISFGVSQCTHKMSCSRIGDCWKLSSPSSLFPLRVMCSKSYWLRIICWYTDGEERFQLSNIFFSWLEWSTNQTELTIESVDLSSDPRQSKYSWWLLWTIFFIWRRWRENKDENQWNKDVASKKKQTMQTSFMIECSMCNDYQTENDILLFNLVKFDRASTSYQKTFKSRSAFFSSSERSSCCPVMSRMSSRASPSNLRAMNQLTVGRIPLNPFLFAYDNRRRRNGNVSWLKSWSSHSTGLSKLESPRL